MRVHVLLILLLQIHLVGAQMKYQGNVQIYLGMHPQSGLRLSPSDSTLHAREIPGTVVGFKADMMLGQRFSFGLLYGMQKVAISVLRDKIQVEEGTLLKAYTGFRGLIHYGKSDWDIYSGLKLGYFYKNVHSVETKAGETPQLKKLNREISFRIGLIPFGVFYHFTENIGLGSEISLGLPAVVSLAARYRFKEI
jgi:hypothetical protein